VILTPDQEWGLRTIANSKSEFLIGIDEVGLGAGAGPFALCGAVFPRTWSHPEVKDSKKFGHGIPAHEKRLRVYREIIQPACLFQHVEVVTHEDIDALGLDLALNDALYRAGLHCSHAFPGAVVAIDGSRNLRLLRAEATVAITKGDSLIPAISAASIIAKTTRDQLMIEYDATYPMYGFKNHMGYLVPEHEKALAEHGPCPIHRKSYKPIARLLPRQRSELVR
jgi:ribonuclease HII